MMKNFEGEWMSEPMADGSDTAHTHLLPTSDHMAPLGQEQFASADFSTKVFCGGKQGNWPQVSRQLNDACLRNAWERTLSIQNRCIGGQEGRSMRIACDQLWTWETVLTSSTYSNPATYPYWSWNLWLSVSRSDPLGFWHRRQNAWFGCTVEPRSCSNRSENIFPEDTASSIVRKEFIDGGFHNLSFIIL